MPATPLSIHVIIGSTRRNRFSEKPAGYVFDELKKEEGVQPELIDLRDWPLPFFDEPITPTRINGNYSVEIAKRWAAKVGEADAFIIVTPEYNHGYPAVLKNAIDWVFPEWSRKPVGFVGYGNAGGARAIEQLRQVVIEMQMLPLRIAVHIPSEVYLAVMKETVPVNPDLFKPLRQGRGGDRLGMFFRELIDLTRTMKAAREAAPAR